MTVPVIALAGVHALVAEHDRPLPPVTGRITGQTKAVSPRPVLAPPVERLSPIHIPVVDTTRRRVPRRATS